MVEDLGVENHIKTFEENEIIGWVCEKLGPEQDDEKVLNFLGAFDKLL
jgi:hypothetical protein